MSSCWGFPNKSICIRNVSILIHLLCVLAVLVYPDADGSPRGQSSQVWKPVKLPGLNP